MPIVGRASRILDASVASPEPAMSRWVLIAIGWTSSVEVATISLLPLWRFGAMPSLSLFEKIWNRHVVVERDDGQTLLYID